MRLAHLWAMRDSLFFQVLLGDGFAYDTWARQIASGDWRGADVFYQAPLYAYFLAAIYAVRHSLMLVRLCQAVVGAGACALVGYASHRLFGRTAGLLAGLMLACYAPAVFAGALVQKSVLDIFFVSLLLALSSDAIADPARPGRWRWLSIGIALGALGLTRENALLFVPVVTGWIWLRPAQRARHGGVRTAMLLAGLSLMLVPVGLRNLIVGGEFHLTTTQAGPNFFIGNNPRADGAYVALRPGRGSPEYERVDAAEIASHAAGRTLSPGEVSAYWTLRALDYIRGNPREWLVLEGRKVRLLSSATEVIDTESQESHEDESPPLRIMARVSQFGVLLPLACLGIWVTWTDRRRIWLLHAMTAAYALSVLAFYVVARYRLPIVPFLTMFASVALARGRDFLTSRTSVTATVGAAGLAAVTAFSNWPAVSPDAMRAATYQNLGAALREAGRLDEAAAAYRRAVSLEPDYAPAHSGLGSVLRQQGRVDEAVAHLETAVRLGPDFDDARFNLANALRDGGQLAQAIARYEELLQRRPDAVDLHANLGVALAEADRLDEAIVHFRRVVALAPHTVKAHYNLGHSLLTRDDVAGAVDELSRAVQIDPQDVASREELGNAYLAQQRFVEAIAQFREAVRLSPRSVNGHNDLGIALGSDGRLDEAIDEFRAALGIDPSFDEAEANLKAALAARQSLRRSR